MSYSDSLLCSSICGTWRPTGRTRIRAGTTTARPGACSRDRANGEFRKANHVGATCAHHVPHRPANLDQSANPGHRGNTRYHDNSRWDWVRLYIRSNLTACYYYFLSILRNWIGPSESHSYRTIFNVPQNKTTKQTRPTKDKLISTWMKMIEPDKTTIILLLWLSDRKCWELLDKWTSDEKGFLAD